MALLSKRRPERISRREFLKAGESPAENIPVENMMKPDKSGLRC